MDISNKFLAFLLVVAIVISVVGVWYSVDRLNRFIGITGFGTEGYVNVTISTMAEINVTQTDCNFGSGYIQAGAATGLIESNGTIINWSGSGTGANLVIENTGNQNVTVNVTSGKTLAQFYGVDCSGDDCEYRAWSTNNNTGSCLGGLQSHPGADMDTTNRTMCTTLQPETAQDSINVHCRLLLSDTIPTGSKTDTWTFYGTQ